MHFPRSFCAAIAALTALALADVTTAQTSRNSTGRQVARGKRITLTQSVAPSFHIEPLINRFEARRGAVVPFQFEIRSTGKAMDVQVMAVQLRQEVSGIILHDANSEPPPEVVFDSNTTFQLAPGETSLITGVVNVPLAKSNFLSFGVLVRDRGQMTTPEVDPNNPNQVKAGVRFVTQYVLRIDIETGVKDMRQMDQLVFEKGRVVNEKGMPVAETYLVNPTDLAFECGVRGTIEASTTSRPRPFRLTMPSRKNVESEERYLVRIMPNSRVALSAPVDSLLFPGKQSLRYEVTNRRRSLVEQGFAIEVARGDYPALETKLAYLGAEMSIEPAQIAVGNIQGAKRTCNLKFSNNSVTPKAVRIELRDLEGQPLEGLRLSKENIEVRPGKTKTVRASISGSTAKGEAQYGEIRVHTIGSDGQPESQTLPLAILIGDPPGADVQVAKLESVERDGHTSFHLFVTNQGEGYVPVHAELAIADGSGRPRELADGFGRWLRPGERRELVFRPEDVLPAGRYQVSLNLTTTEDAEPVRRTLIIELDPDLPQPGIAGSAETGSKNAG